METTDGLALTGAEINRVIEGQQASENPLRVMARDRRLGTRDRELLFAAADELEALWTFAQFVADCSNDPVVRAMAIKMGAKP